MDNEHPVRSQMSDPGVPLQVESVVYNMPVKAVRSKIGLTALGIAVSAWVIAFLLTALYSSFTKLFGLEDAGDYIANEAKKNLALAFSLLVPFGFLLWFANKRFQAIVQANPAAIEDLFFKGTIRTSLVISSIGALFWIFVALYNFWAKLLNIDAYNKGWAYVFHNWVFAFIACALVYFFWCFQRKTQR